MAILTMILGESGSGKTTSFRNIDPKKAILYKTINKPLPFKNSQWKESTAITHDFQRIIHGIKKAESLKKEIIIIDDFQYLMSEEFISRASEKGYDKFTEIAVHAHAVIKAAQEAPDYIRIYFTWHTQIDENGITRAKTIGKLLDDKICIEGLFTIVLKSLKRDGQYFFATQSNGFDVCKSPMELFNSDLIENDLSQVDKCICDYYQIDNLN